MSAAPARQPSLVPAAIWHEAECGSYHADLELWLELAAAHPGPVLELGTGAGRVALTLAAAGHEVLGIDIEPELIAVLNARARERRLPARGAVGDVRAPAPPGERSLILAPMQLIQLLAGSEERQGMLAAAAGRLAPGGAFGLAIVEGVPTDAGEDDAAPILPDVVERDGCVYSSLPLGVTRDGDRMVISRLRQIVAPDGGLTESRHTLSLAIVTAAEIEAEAAQAGLAGARLARVPATMEHVGSSVLILEAA